MPKKDVGKGKNKWRSEPEETVSTTTEMSSTITNTAPSAEVSFTTEPSVTMETSTTSETSPSTETSSFAETSITTDTSLMTEESTATPGKVSTTLQFDGQDYVLTFHDEFDSSSMRFWKGFGQGGVWATSFSPHMDDSRYLAEIASSNIISTAMTRTCRARSRFRMARSPFTCAN